MGQDKRKNDTLSKKQSMPCSTECLKNEKNQEMKEEREKVDTQCNFPKKYSYTYSEHMCTPCMNVVFILISSSSSFIHMTVIIQQ